MITLDPNSTLSIRGAHEHNLKHVDLDIPCGSLVVFTGVSGSGKSSLAFDTIFREGQRRYLETFPSYARQLLGKLDRPAVERIQGLSPALAVDQKTRVVNPRSTVGTLSELYPLVRLLYARLGQPHCSQCGSPLALLSPEQLAALLEARFRGREVVVLAPLIDGHKGSLREEITRASTDGFTEVRLEGVLVPSSPLPEVDPSRVHQLELPIARLVPDKAQPGLLRDSVARALRFGRGALKILAGQQVERFETARACSSCGAQVPEIGPRLFSFNSPYGACPECKGLGVQDAVDPELFVADANKSLRQGALVLTTPTGYMVYSQVTIDVLNQVCQAHGFDVDIPWKELTDEQRRVVLYGSDRLRIPFGKHPLENRLKWKGITARPREEGTYKGIVPILEEILKRNRNDNALRFVRSRPCTACHGQRLRTEALAVRFHDKSITELCALPLDQLAGFLTSLTFSDDHRAVGETLRAALLLRIDTLRKLGLGYLTLSREAPSLSGGETQRLRLATQVDNGLSRLLYVLDEPSVGLHARDTGRLLEVLGRLRAAGNSVLVVEHDEETIQAAQWVVDIGPGAGPQGGTILYSGPARPRQPRNAESQTRSAVEESPAPLQERWLWVRGAAHNNLRDIDVPFRLSALNVVTGVSGAGKSSLVDDILARELRRRLHGATQAPGRFRALEGVEPLDKVIEIDQAPIGRTPRSNPATYTGIADAIRDQFAALPESKERGWGKGRFSFNVAGGRCEDCGGAGVQSVGMHFLADVEVVCETCGGRRFSEDTLEVRWRGLSICDVLNLTVEEALPYFAQGKAAQRLLEALLAVGLGYLSLGQPATTLSGGEAQRLKLAAELGRASTGNTLYILDEPTTGLHARDVAALLQALRALVSRGNTVLVVEHHLDLLRAADWVVDLGPEGGPEGGRLVAAGSLAQVAAVETSPTGRVLREYLQRSEAQSPGAGAPSVAQPRWSGPPAAPPPLRLRGVSTHNLQNVAIEIPANKLTVITGVSGSGKSSLAFDSLVQEGQRRFTASLSSYARRYMPRARAPEIEEATGLSAPLAVGQHAAPRNPRSTVGTLSEVYDDLRLIYSRAGVPHCPRCAVPLKATTCPQCGFVGSPLTARLFSFNHAQGACERCRGLGVILSCDPERLVTDPSRSLLEGALDGTKTGAFYGDPKGQQVAILKAVGTALGLDFRRPYRDLEPHERRIAMYGTGDDVYPVTWHWERKKALGDHVWNTTWKGFVGYVNEEYERKHADDRGEALRPVLAEVPCDACNGDRLGPALRAVRFVDRTLGELCRLSLRDLEQTLEAVENQLDDRSRRLTAEARQEARDRLRALCEIGLPYLTLDRSVSSLSGGELQRLRLATQLRSGLRGVTYVLDEPTVGLHARDTAALLRILRRLCAQDNTVVVVEHDPEVLRAADHLIDLGPGAGQDGGRVVVAGGVEQVCACAASATGKYLSAPAQMIPVPNRRPLSAGVQINGACVHNLHLDCAIPAGGLIAVTGVSGSGKSSLVHDVLLASAQAKRPVGCSSITGLDQFRDVLSVDQGLPAGGPWSTAVSMVGAFDGIRALFANTEIAKARRWTKSRFSLSSKGGRCEACQGAGHIAVRLDFLPDVHLPCETCRGARFSAETLEATWRAHTVAEVLTRTGNQALELFAGIDEVVRPLRALCRAGLGYVPLGQPVGTLSGGEAQRLRLAAELAGETKGRTLYAFDEPTTGLHPLDVSHLLRVLSEIVEQGHTVVVVEHHLEVLKCADYVLDLGPEGGDRGGRLVVAGTPEQVAQCEESATGRALREVLRSATRPLQLNR